ncbi:MAG: hypothetical protein C0483_14355 [Pirellula sp.]|nr:hypothetical protein [Pirellula sp.]
MNPTPSIWQRLGDYFLVRRANQTIIALCVVAVLILVAVWWVRNGGLDGTLEEHDRPAPHESKTTSKTVPERKADFVVDVNHAEVAELVELPGVGQAIAERIVEYRKQNGPFQSVDDLREVTGIGPKTLEALRPHVRVK